MDALLVTKLTKPRLDRTYLERPPVAAFLQAGLQRRLTALVAGAGHGKSVTLAHFLDRCPLPHLWIQLDAQDADLATFCQYLAFGIAERLGGGSRARSRLRSPGAAMTAASLVPALVHDLAECPECVVALDDFHFIPENSPMADLWRELLAYGPANVHLYFTSRSPLPFPLARLKALQEADELREADLRFSPDQTRAFLRATPGCSPEPEMIEQVVDLAEGWPAALVLFSAALRRPAALRALHSNQLPADLFHYLAEEVFAGLAADVRSFLEETSILDTCHVPACVEIFGRPDAGLVFERLAAANLPVFCLNPQAYRYHQLLLRFLQERLAARDGGRTAQCRHHEAARWFQQHDMPEAAVRHYLRAGAADAAMALVETLAPVWLRRNQMDRLRELLAMLPPETTEIRPWIALCHARQHFAQGQFDTALGMARLALRGFRERTDARGLAQGHVLVGVLHANRQQYEEASEELAQARHCLAPGMVLEEAQVLHQSARLALAQGGPQAQAEPQVRRAVSLYVEAGDMTGEAAAADLLGLLRAFLGDYASAVTHLERSADLQRAGGEPAHELGINLGWVYYQLGRFQEARQIFVPMLARSSLKVRRAYAALNLVEACTRTGEWNAALDYAQTASGLIEELGHKEARLVLLCDLAALYRLWDKPEAAQPNVRQALRLVADVRFAPRILRVILEAALWHLTHSGNCTAVRKLVARGLSTAGEDEERWFRTLLIGCDAVAAFRLARSQWRPEGARLLQQFLSNCQRWGFHAMALHEWPLVTSAAVLGLAYGVEAEFCFTLLRKMHSELPEAVRARGIPLRETEARLVPAAWQALPDDAARQQLADLLAPPDRRRLMALATGPQPLVIGCLGPLEVQVGGHRLDHKSLKRRKAGLLLALLICHDGPIHREQLLDSLWPDLDLAAADTSLRVAIHYLRRLLEPHLGGRGKSRYLQAEGGLVWFNRHAEVSIDIDVFRQNMTMAEAAARSGDLTAAVDLYEQALGHYRDAVDGGDLAAEGFDALWATEAQRYRAALSWLGEYYWSQAHDGQRAVTCYQRLLHSDPANEAAYQALIRICLAAGQVAEARRQLVACRDALRQYVDAGPSPATLALAELIPGSEPAPVDGESAVGRSTKGVVRGQVRNVDRRSAGR